MKGERLNWLQEIRFVSFAV
uniref:Uncharacterized protein n=1 Tax=Anguilla anguilla TaxID=7936 RepID=A0A0E9TP17_ANGAN